MFALPSVGCLHVPRQWKTLLPITSAMTLGETLVRHRKQTVGLFASVPCSPGPQGMTLVMEQSWFLLDLWLPQNPECDCPGEWTFEEKHP